MKLFQQLMSFLKTYQLILTLSTVVLSLSISIIAVSVSTSVLRQTQDDTPLFRMNLNQLEYKDASSSTWTVLFDMSQLNVEEDTSSVGIEFRSTDEAIEWKHSTASEWSPLLSLSELIREDGRAIELRSTATDIEWKYIDDTTWTRLIERSVLQGERGFTGRQGPIGERGPQGLAGLSPSIGGNGNWFIGSTDTGVRAAGSGLSPFVLVSTPEELQAMQECLDCSYMLTEDIDLMGFTWTPVGTIENPFTGRLYGQGFTIDNLSVNDRTKSQFGLFGVASNILIQDVYVDNFDNDIVANNDVGYFIGHLRDGVNYLSNIHISANDDISGTSGVGYLIGRTSFATLYLSSIFINGSDIDALSHVGSLIGMVEEFSYISIQNLDMSSTDVYATSGIAGGLIGEINDSQVEIFDSVMVFDVYADGNYVGGLVGYGFDADITLMNTIMTGQIQNFNSTNSFAGGLVGACLDCTVVLQNTHLGGHEFIDLFQGEEHIGGLIGYISESIIILYQSSIHVELEGRQNVGGVIGSVVSIDLDGSITESSRIDISQSDFRVRIYDYSNPQVLVNAGGIVGYAYGLVTDWNQITMDFITINVAEGQNIGGAIGYLNYLYSSGGQDYLVDNEVDIKGFTIIGEITIQNTIATSNNVNVGGIVGHLQGDHLLSSGSIGQDSWTNSGVRQSLELVNVSVRFHKIDVSGFHVGGMVGFADGGDIIVYNSDVRSNLITENEFIGGIVGAGSGMSLRTEIVTVEGRLDAGDVVGGFIGFTDGINRIVLDYSRSELIGKFADIGTYVNEGDIYGFISEDTYIDFETSEQASDGLRNNS